MVENLPLMLMLADYIMFAILYLLGAVACGICYYGDYKDAKPNIFRIIITLTPILNVILGLYGIYKSHKVL